MTKFNRYVGENDARGVIRLVTIYSISCSLSNIVCYNNALMSEKVSESVVAAVRFTIVGTNYTGCD